MRGLAVWHATRRGRHMYEGSNALLLIHWSSIRSLGRRSASKIWRNAEVSEYLRRPPDSIAASSVPNAMNCFAPDGVHFIPRSFFPFALVGMQVSATQPIRLESNMILRSVGPETEGRRKRGYSESAAVYQYGKKHIRAKISGVAP